MSISSVVASSSCDAKCRRVVKMVQERYPSSELLAAGWSLGGNILVRYVGEEGDQCPISAAASLCNPLDLVSCFCRACDCFVSRAA
jgi:predicted alpha/beta-fold hydrolase